MCRTGFGSRVAIAGNCQYASATAAGTHKFVDRFRAYGHDQVANQLDDEDCDEERHDGTRAQPLQIIRMLTDDQDVIASFSFMLE